MKRIALLFTLTLMIASTLHTKQQKPEWIHLPKDIHSVIIAKALEVSETIDEAIIAIEKLSKVYGAQFDKLFNNLKDFTALVHILADKFNLDTLAVAEKFDTSISREYRRLGTNLLNALSKNNTTQVSRAIKLGADVNLTFTGLTPLNRAVMRGNTAMVKLLLDFGAQVHYLSKDTLYLLKSGVYSPELTRLIEEAKKDE